MALVSNCCGALNRNGIFHNSDADFAQYGICPECLDHCEFEEEAEPEQVLRQDNWGTPGNSEFMLSLKNQTK